MSQVIRSESVLVSSRELFPPDTLRITVFIGEFNNSPQLLHVGGIDENLEDFDLKQEGGMNISLSNISKIQTGNP